MVNLQLEPFFQHGKGYLPAGLGLVWFGSTPL